MLLVLTILVILANVAIRATNGLADQARYEASQRLMTNLQEAVLGDDTLRQPDGTRIANGFVNDIGAPPTAVGSDPATQLSQLWESNGLSTYGPMIGSNAVVDGGGVSDTEDANVQLFMGWRGPYLNLPPGTDSLKDGWGNLLNLTFSSSVLQSATSLGSDGQNGANGDVYSADMGTSSTNFITDSQGTLTGRVQTWDPSGTWVVPTSSLTVKLFYPVNGTLHRKDATEANGFYDSTTGSFSFTNVPVGMRALKVTDPISGKFVIRYLFVTKGGVNQDLLLK